MYLRVLVIVYFPNPIVDADYARPAVPRVLDISTSSI